MTRTYSRTVVIQMIVAKHGGTPWVFLDERPMEKYIRCINCSRVTVRITWERLGDGTEDHINWIVDTWVGRCQRRDCRYLNLWIELIGSEELDRENRRLLRELCDRELKSL